MKTLTTSNFKDLLRNFEENYEFKAKTLQVDQIPELQCYPLSQEWVNEIEISLTNSLKELATACTFSVLRKLSLVGGTVTEKSANKDYDSAKVIRDLRSDLKRDLENVKHLEYAMDNATSLEFDANGNVVRLINDAELNETASALCGETVSEASDLLQTAMTAILSESEKITASGVWENFMEQPYTVTRLKRKVRIKSSDSKNGFETVQTTPIQEVYKAIRRDVENSRALQVASHKYTYLEDSVTNPTTGEIISAYIRLPKYSSLSTPVTNANGKTIALTVDKQTVEDTDSILRKLNLTAKQAQIIDLRLRGYGYSAIATYLGVKKSTIVSNLKGIQKKALEIGLKPKTPKTPAKKDSKDKR